MLKDLGLAVGLGTIVVAPFLVLSGAVAGGFFLYNKLRGKPTERVARIAGDLGVEGEWETEDTTEEFGF